MDKFRYLLLLAACVAVTLPLELVLGVRVYRQPRRLITTVLPVAAVFAVWDRIGVAHGDWRFAGTYTIGLRIAGLPLEEWLFVLVIPICAVMAYEAVGRHVPRPRTVSQPAPPVNASVPAPPVNASVPAPPVKAVDHDAR
jgi:lycopene cyclase domain-containing protein